MKPIKLIMSAFGPYPDLMPEIDFEQFKDRGLFLIAGDTGAGKTTIFDAICFALFGATSGSFRDTKNLRSEYAADSVESFVDFYFSHQGKNYHIKRSPEYERSKQRGEGTINIKEKATLYEEGQIPLEGVKQVNAKVQELLGLDYKQFKQVAMIAQGEFWQLLNAKSEERGKILRSIFNTDGYNALEYKLKDRMDNSYKLKEKTESSIIQYFCDVKVDEECELKATLEELQKKANEATSIWNLGELLETIANIEKSDKCLSKNVAKQLLDENQKLDKYKENQVNAENNNQIIKRLETFLVEKKDLENKKEENKNKEIILEKQKSASRYIWPVYKQWADKKNDLERLNLEIQTDEETCQYTKFEAKTREEILKLVDSELIEIDSLSTIKEKLALEKDRCIYNDNLAGDIDNLAGGIDNLAGDIDNLISRLNNLELDKRELLKEEELLHNQINEFKLCIEELKDAPVKANEEKHVGDELCKLKNCLMDLLTDKRSDLDKRRESLTDKQQKFDLARTAYDEALNKRLKSERILENCRAGLLAQTLIDNEKCPVCGSIHHPEPATMPENLVTEEFCNELKEIETEKQNAKAEALTQVETDRVLLESLEENFIKEAEECLGNGFLHIQCVDKKIDSIIEALQRADSDVKLMVCENNEIQRKLNKDCETLKEVQANLEKAQGADTESLSKRRDGLKQQKEEILKTAREENFACSERVASIKASLDTKRKQLYQQEKDEKELSLQVEELVKAHSFRSLEESKEYFVDEKSMTETEKELNNYRQLVATNKIQLEQAQKDAEGRALIDLENLKTTCNEQGQYVEKIRKRLNSIDSRIDSNRQIKEKIEAQKTTYEDANKAYLMTRRLYELVKGQTKSGKLTLEQYVQAAGFDGIIRAANRRLFPMSEGQYELHRQEDSLGKRSNTFFDLEVLDNYTGHSRPVGNLSGGESFKASLSLALGLSDTVSANSGGIQMDALFVDEGFGTLDKKSIENAMDILVSLSGSKKLVGIISHREELLESIPQKILVKKTKDGSEITVETD